VPSSFFTPSNYIILVFWCQTSWWKSVAVISLQLGHGQFAMFDQYNRRYGCNYCRSLVGSHMWSTEQCHCQWQGDPSRLYQLLEICPFPLSQKYSTCTYKANYTECRLCVSNYVYCYIWIQVWFTSHLQLHVLIHKEMIISWKQDRDVVTVKY